MKRRDVLAALALLPMVAHPAHARATTLSIGIFPGTGSAEMFRDLLRDATKPFTQVLASAVGRTPALTMFSSLKSINRSLENGRLDLYFVPPTSAVAALEKGYTPIARVKDPITVVLVRRKGAAISSVALTERESLPDVLGRYVIKGKKENVKLFNLKTQEDVILALERNYAQAGGLGGKLAKTLLEKGGYEVWHPLPPAPGFTLVGSSALSADEKSRLGQALRSIDPAVVEKMQKVFVSKLGSFVTDDGGDFKTLSRAMKASGYL